MLKLRPLAMSALVLAGVVLATSGCRSRPPLEWVDEAVLAPPPSERFAESPAEILYLKRTLRMSAVDDWYYQEQHHEVRRINDESGLDWANVYFAFAGSETLVDFRARSIAPDGTQRELEEDDLFIDTSGHATVVSFRFPHAEVGSLLEFIHTVERDNGYKLWDEAWASGNLPVRTFRLDIQGTDNIVRKLKIFNVADDALQRASIGGWWRVTASVDDLPAYVAEPFGPTLTRGGVWYLYKTKRIGKRKLLRTWASETLPLSKKLYEEHPWRVGFDDSFEPGDCQGRECLARVVDSVHADTELDTRSLARDPRPLHDALAARRVSSYEKAVLLWHRLERAGLEARYALVTVDPRAFFDVEMPWLDALDHVLVYVPEQEGIAEPVWIDPSCEWCAPGELPHGSDRNHAIILRKQGKKAYAEPSRPQGTLLPAEQTARTTRLEVAADGTARVHETIVTSQAAAERHWRATRDVSPEDRLAALHRELAERFPRREQLQLSTDCDRRQGRCVEERHYELPSYAVADAEQLHVPLTILDNPLEESVARPERYFDIIFDERSYSHQLAVTAPAGFALRDVPADRNTSAARGTVVSHVHFEAAGEQPARLAWSLHLAESTHTPQTYPEIRAALRLLTGLRSSALTFARAPAPQLPAEALPASE